MAWASNAAVTGEVDPDGAVTVQVCLADEPTLRLPAATGDDGLMIQPAAVLRPTDTLLASPGPSLRSVVVTVVDSPAGRLSGVEGSMPSSSAAGSPELTGRPPISATIPGRGD